MSVETAAPVRDWLEKELPASRLRALERVMGNVSERERIDILD